MSSDEEVMHSEEEESEEEEESREPTPERDETEVPPPEDSGPSEAELAMQRRRAAKMDTSALDEEAQELLEANKQLRSEMEEEIEEMRARSERRKKEREEEERQLAIRRAEEEARRKKEEEERNSKKRAEEEAKREARAAKMAEFEKWKNVSTPNFVINKKSGGDDAGGEEGDEDDEQTEKKSKEQLEAEKRAILNQRTPTLEISGFDSGKLTEKAKELHNLIVRLESEKYDLEKCFKAQQIDMMELAEKARQMNKIGKGGQLKRVQITDETDVMSERFAGCPAKIEMYSKYERQKDKRNYGERHTIFKGPQYLYPADRIAPTRILKWSEEGLPLYEETEGGEGEQQ